MESFRRCLYQSGQRMIHSQYSWHIINIVSDAWTMVNSGCHSSSLGGSNPQIKLIRIFLLVLMLLLPGLARASEPPENSHEHYTSVDTLFPENVQSYSRSRHQEVSGVPPRSYALTEVLVSAGPSIL